MHWPACGETRSFDASWIDSISISLSLSHGNCVSISVKLDTSGHAFYLLSSARGCTFLDDAVVMLVWVGGGGWAGWPDGTPVASVGEQVVWSVAVPRQPSYNGLVL